MAIIPTTSPVAAPVAPARALLPCATASAAFTTAWAATRPAPSGVVCLIISAIYGAALRLPPASPCTAAVAACIAC
ncbi:hypothetical protein FCZ59_02910 [Escherichia coli]|nr:hypothetical protein [Escherichia coli]